MIYKIDYFELSFLKDSPIIEQPLADLKLPAKYQIYIMKIQRTCKQKALNLLPMTYQEMAGPTSIIHANDDFYVQGTEKDVERFVK